MNRDTVVIGGSAGAVEATLHLARELPGDLPAAVFIVIHTSPDGRGEMAGLLDRAGPLACSTADDGEEIRRGRIFLAKPDHHLLVESGKVCVVRGPRENRHRPAIDPLFRSAAVNYGPRVVGVVLSGTLDDGSAGLSVVKRMGGRAVVQDPRDAIFSGMPQNAMNMVKPDHVAPIKEIAAILSRIVREEAKEAMEASESDRAEAGISANRLVGEEKMRELAAPSVFSCPDCGGVLFEIEDGATTRYRCSIGHGRTAQSLLASQSEHVGEALAASFRSLVENQRLYDRLIQEFSRRNMHLSASEMKQKSEAAKKHADVIRTLLDSAEKPGS